MDLTDYLGLLYPYSKAQSNTLSSVRSRVLTSVDSCPCRILVGGRKSLLRKGSPNETPLICKLPIIVSPITKLKTLLYFILLNIPLSSISITFYLKSVLLYLLQLLTFSGNITVVLPPVPCFSCIFIFGHALSGLPLSEGGESILDLTTETLDVLKWVWGKI